MSPLGEGEGGGGGRHNITLVTGGLRRESNYLVTRLLAQLLSNSKLWHTVVIHLTAAKNIHPNRIEVLALLYTAKNI